VGNIRQAIRRGLDDAEWANAELGRLRVEREQLLARQKTVGAEPEVLQFDLAAVEKCHQRFAQVFAEGTNEEKRAFARLFVKKIEVDPDTGEILMHLLSRPPALTPRVGPKRTLASMETSVRIGMVAGACYVVYHDAPTRTRSIAASN
jgi:hypothetical protein